MASNMDDARDTFKYLKSEGFWQKHAMFWSEWAAFGYQYKGAEKALKILNQGRRERRGGARPISIVEEMKRDHRGRVVPDRRAGRSRAAAAGIEPAAEAWIRTRNRERWSWRSGETMLLARRNANVATRAAADAAAEERARLEATVSIPRCDPAGGYGGGYAYMNDENAPPRAEGAAVRRAEDAGGGGGARRRDDGDLLARIRRGAHHRAAAAAATAARGASARGAGRGGWRTRPSWWMPDAAQQQFSGSSRPRPQARAAAGRSTPPRRRRPRRRRARRRTAAAHAASAAASAAADARGRGRLEEKKKRAQDPRELRDGRSCSGVKYLKLECVGQGGTCKVYKVLCPKRKTYALKRIQSRQGARRRRSRGSWTRSVCCRACAGEHNIIQLVDAEVCKSEGLIYVVLEYGEIDLARLLVEAREATRQGADGEGAG